MFPVIEIDRPLSDGLDEEESDKLDLDFIRRLLRLLVLDAATEEYFLIDGLCAYGSRGAAMMRIKWSV